MLSILVKSEQFSISSHNSLVSFTIFIGVSELDFLGHHVDATGICPLESKVQSIQEFPRPDTQRKLQRFLRLANFYHRFIPHGATIF